MKKRNKQVMFLLLGIIALISMTKIWGQVDSANNNPNIIETSSKPQNEAIDLKKKNVLNNKETKVNSLQAFFSEVDKALDSSLAATLAGLALAMATFLLSYSAPLSAEIQNTIVGGHIPGNEKVKLLTELKSLINKTTKAFFFFLLALGENFSIDILNEKENILATNDFATLGDIALNMGLLAIGISYLIKSAKLMPKMV